MKRVLADDGVGIFAFTSLDDVAFASKLLNKYSLSSTLYKDSENQCYYLSLTDLDDSPNSTVMDEIHQLYQNIANVCQTHMQRKLYLMNI